MQLLLFFILYQTTLSVNIIYMQSLQRFEHIGLHKQCMFLYSSGMRIHSGHIVYHVHTESQIYRNKK